MQIVDMIEEDDALETEQAIFDKSDDKVSSLTIHLQCLMLSFLAMLLSLMNSNGEHTQTFSSGKG